MLPGLVYIFACKIDIARRMHGEFTVIAVKLCTTPAVQAILPRFTSINTPLDIGMSRIGSRLEFILQLFYFPSTVCTPPCAHTPAHNKQQGHARLRANTLVDMNLEVVFIQLVDCGPIGLLHKG